MYDDIKAGSLNFCLFNKSSTLQRFNAAFLSFLAVMCLSMLSACTYSNSSETEGAWEIVDAIGEPTARHEASIVAFEDKIYLLGGRRINPTDVFNPRTKTWTKMSSPPIEIHHFQAVVVGDAIYILGAMTGPWPHETPLERVLIYYPKTDTFEFGAEIPKARRRGGAGAVYANGKIYLVGGITDGHMGTYVNWFDAYDVETDDWVQLPDAPHRRDHFQAAISGDKLYAFAGRRSEQRADLGFEQTIIPGNVFDFKTGQWEDVTKATNLPTPRAGNMMTAYDGKIIVGGGESGTQIVAHNEVEVFDTVTKEWKNWPRLGQGRHGSGFSIVGNYIYTISGSGNRGGGPELTTVERLKLPMSASNERSTDSAKPLADKTTQPVKSDALSSSEPQLWHTLTLDFEGVDTSETAEDNPFTNYRLLVEFTHGDKSYLIRGFYAADGDAANTSSTKGNIWRVRFTPDEIGEWRYKASFHRGPNIAIERDPSVGEPINIDNADGKFTVIDSQARGKDFKASNRGRLRQEGKLFRFEKSGKYWLKGGPNSPENLLGYKGFDDTYRILKESREGEASTEGDIHDFAPHRKDWKEGDPLWGTKTREARGHSIIGAMNYIANQGMNTAYFLTNNIKGDGNDVWPYESPTEFDRFDVSKLEQWNVLFGHMQAKGILLHVVTQETENEQMLDGGDTKFYRSLYYSELISRFGHHPALVWNLGEENGPSSWMKTGQSHQQRKDMATFFSENDPYNHTVLVHSHAATEDIEYTFVPLLGHQPLDGISLQIENAEDVHEITKDWHKRSSAAGKPWLVTMDEIGPWYNGALPDDIDPDHDYLRRHVLWGHLLAGGAGVEWYFGGRFHSNDVSAEDWRTRHNLWSQTRHALEFFEQYLPYWNMGECEGAVWRRDVYCLGTPGEIYAFYMPGRGSAMMGLPENDTGGYTVAWYDPKTGGNLQIGSVSTLGFGGNQFIGYPPNNNTKDWVVLIRKM